MNAHWAKMQITYMKNRALGFLAVLTASIMVWSCSGNVDPDEVKTELILKADKTELVADGKDQIIFTATYGFEDVTSAAEIRCISEGASVSQGKFSTDKEGTYTFRATYMGTESEPVSIKAAAPAESRFERRVCVMEFTGSWCAQCPEGATTLNYLTGKAYKDKAYSLAFHNDDAYALAEEQVLKAMFKWSGYPAYVTDMRDCGLINEGGCGGSIEKSLYDVPTHCAAAVSCSYDSASGQVTVNAKVFSEQTMEYRLAAYVVEDKVKGEQTLATGEVQEDYTHRHVVRQMLSADVRGDRLGKISSGKEAASTYTFKIDEGWNLENISVAVLAIASNGEVNNMAVCAADGGVMEYGIK